MHLITVNRLRGLSRPRNSVVLVNPLGGLSLPWNSVVRLIDCLDMTIAVYCGRKVTSQQVFNT